MSYMEIIFGRSTTKTDMTAMAVEGMPVVGEFVIVHSMVVKVEEEKVAKNSMTTDASLI